MLTQTMITESPRRPASKAARGRPPVEAQPLGGSIELMGACLSFARNVEIYGEGETAEYLYKVVSGTVRTSKILADGRRQIGAFYLPGDMFGLEMGEEHTFSAEAIADAKVLVIKRSAVTALAQRDSDVAHELWTVTGRELHRVQEHVLLLIKTAQERVAGFLLEMAQRERESDEVELPMSRQDIADYLGLTIETVSRTLTHLAATAVIEVPSSRRIVLRNRAALARLNG
ncbi:MAG TPA: helix-turn-helix domain-containing protein [Xanthobacteraceae bacterium]|nr:helix-turn-helix domain-containing protein [Xanthobacteraceae bacterium]